VSKPILLVDDEPALAELLLKYLQRLGYEVEACLSAEDALVRFDADPARYALVLTDLTLPGIGGDEMLERMRAQRPTLRAIVCSGYPYVPRSKKIVFLQKPFMPKMLAEAIEKLLR
jgi:two-component system cell cycle sensor histidine kinase/response regulator CckA